MSSNNYNRELKQPKIKSFIKSKLNKYSTFTSCAYFHLILEQTVKTMLMSPKC